MTSSLPNSIQNFARRYLIYSLANAANLQRWELKENSSCFLCVHKKTQIHLFNNYKWASNRYEWRHDSVLKTLMNNFVTIALERFRLPANIDGCDSLSQLLRSSRPQVPGADKYQPRSDNAIQERNKTTIIELTCSFETNPEKSSGYKKTRYKNLRGALHSPRAHFNLILLEISSSRFIESTRSFEQFLKSKDLDAKRIIPKFQEVAQSIIFYLLQSK